MTSSGNIAMPDQIPDGITRADLLDAIRDFDRGVPHQFAPSTGYDVLYEGKRYPPKPIVGLAAQRLTGRAFGPYDFKGGRGSKCFRVLTENQFTIITKADQDPFPDELDPKGSYVEGAGKQVTVNRYERDPKARAACIAHYGAQCQVCGLRFEEQYGAVGAGFIHVHHIVPLARIGREYAVDPIRDLVPVCPNCHAMLHKREPPFTVAELKALMPHPERTSTT